ncbi:hypothetical protein HGA88_03895 [Candidatus Roizmanbacteria bacterium]|nr:hypothetical protein [Candidatus Roizmanbacteria bacterium]
MTHEVANGGLDQKFQRQVRLPDFEEPVEKLKVPSLPTFPVLHTFDIDQFNEERRQTCVRTQKALAQQTPIAKFTPEQTQLMNDLHVLEGYISLFGKKRYEDSEFMDHFQPEDLHALVIKLQQHDVKDRYVYKAVAGEILDQVSASSNILPVENFERTTKQEEANPEKLVMRWSTLDFFALSAIKELKYSVYQQSLLHRYFPIIDITPVSKYGTKQYLPNVYNFILLKSILEADAGETNICSQRLSTVFTDNYDLIYAWYENVIGHIESFQPTSERDQFTQKLSNFIEILRARRFDRTLNFGMNKWYGYDTTAATAWQKQEADTIKVAFDNLISANNGHR